MKKDWKTILKGLLAAVFLLGVGGTAVLYASILFMLGLAPLYVAKAFPILGGTVVLAGALSVSGFLPKRWKKRLWTAVLVVTMGCGVYAGIGAYNDSVPAIEDRDGLIYEYEPFADGTKAVYLD